MDKVLYIGHLREGYSGWARAAFGYLRALKTQFDVVARSVKLDKDVDPPEDIQELINKGSTGAKYCIQHVLPHFLDKSGVFEKNLSISILETSNILYTDWCSKINLMDETWVPYTEGLGDSSISIPRQVVPHACNIREYHTIYPTFPLPPSFNFYCIGEFIRRKNFPTLVRAFHSEFTPNEPVNLILKTGIPNHSPEESRDHIRKSVNTIKEGLKLYPSVEYYKPDIIVTEPASREQIMALHQAGHCYVNTSYGESWGWGLFDAMGMGNACLSIRHGGPKDFLEGYSNTYWVDSRLEPAYATLDTFKDIQTSHENYWSIDILDLRKQIRNVYENWKKKREEGIEAAKKYSYNNVGSICQKTLLN